MDQISAEDKSGLFCNEEDAENGKGTDYFGFSSWKSKRTWKYAYKFKILIQLIVGIMSSKLCTVVLLSCYNDCFLRTYNWPFFVCSLYFVYIAMSNDERKI